MIFRRHVSVLLVAYVHGELTADEETRVRDHLKECDRCQREYRDIRSVNRALRFMPSTAAEIDGDR